MKFIADKSLPLSVRPDAALVAAVVIVAAVVAAVLFAPATGAQPPGGSEGGPPPAAVRTAEARAQMVSESVLQSGTLEAPRSAVVATEVAGIVDALLVREGESVERGKPLARLRREPFALRLDAVRGQLAEAEAQKALAERQLERQKRLKDDDVIPQELLDQAAYNAQGREGRCEQLRAEVARLERELELSAIPAPFSGIVGGERTEVGEWLAVGDPVVELIDLDPLEVRVDVPERHFAGLEIGGRVPVRFEAFPGRVFEGRLRAIVPSADPVSRAFPVLVRVDNAGQRLGAGMLAEVELPTGSERRAVVVPKDAVLTEGAKRFVYVVDAASTAQKIAVITGPSAGLWIAVDGEIEAGDQVVVRGNERLFPGGPVAAEPLEIDAP